MDRPEPRWAIPAPNPGVTRQALYRFASPQGELRGTAAFMNPTLHQPNLDRIREFAEAS